jgi:tight adherence protein B
MMTRGPRIHVPLATRIARLRFRPDPAAGVDAIAVVVERLAVLVSAGVPAAVAWAQVLNTSDPARTLP